MALSLYFLKGNLLEDISVKVFASQRLCAFCHPDKLSHFLTDWLWNYGWLFKAMAAVDFDSSSSHPTGSLIKSVLQCEWCEGMWHIFLMYMLNDTQKTQSLVKPCAVSACWYEGRRKLAAWFCFRCWCYLSTEYASSPAIENESLQLKSLRSNLSPQVLKRWEKERLGGFAKCKTRAMQMTGIHNLHQFICVWELIYDTFWFSWCLFCISRLCN